MEFNPQQLQAIGCDARHILVLAGAGTGKTRTIIGRAARLIRGGAAAERLAVITFTRRAAGEIQRRLTCEVGETCRRMVAGTFHNFCLREMLAHPQWFELSGSTIVDRDDQGQLIKLVRGEVIGRGGAAAVPQAPQLLDYYSYARNTNQPIADYLKKYTDKDESTIKVMLRIFAAYEKRKQASGYLDFDDILYRFATVLRRDPQVRQRVASGYDHVLVDEMQDTNPLQWLILESLAPTCQLFCVGDDAQSIYAFRGADFRNVHSFTERLPGATVLKLQLNYRSTQEILDLSNWLLAQSPLKYDKQLQAHRGPGQPPWLIESESEFDEAEWVVNDVLANHQQGLRWDQQMIMCRTSYSARPVEAELIRRKIPYRFIGGVGLLQMAHVKDLLSILRIVVNHQDELAWVRYLTLWPGIGEVTAARYIRQLSQAEDALSALKLAERLVGRPELIKPLVTAHKNRQQPDKCVRSLAKLIDDLMATRYDNWETRARDFRLIERLAKRHDDIKVFLDTYTLDPISPSDVAANDQEDVLLLITVHSAKGTEAKVCYVVAAQPGNYPHYRSQGNPEAMEEERRVLYVALTRAQDRLVVSRNWSAGMAQSSWKNPTTPSYFLERLPGQLVNRNPPRPQMLKPTARTRARGGEPLF